MRTSLLSVLILTFSAATLVACGSSDTAGSPSASSKRVTPSDPNLASLYNSSCISCHSSGYGSAPRSGDAAAWAPRMEKGIDTLVDNAINGINGMPPLGACTDCTEQDYIDLIQFMATPAE